MDNILFIGAGNMAEAIISGLISAKIYDPTQIKAFDINKTRLQFIKDTYKIITCEKYSQDIKKSNIIVLAVKPNVITSVLKEISSYYSNQLIISIAAGVSTDTIIQSLGKSKKAKVLRVMPNMPALVGSGMSVICKAGNISDSDMEKGKKIFSAIGEVEELPESCFNAVTGLSGSGPAYMFLILEAFMEAGVKLGINKDIALKLAVQTMFGSAQMAKITNLHPADLKNKVTSPGGTTIDGLYELEKGALRALITSAVEAASKKSEILLSKG